MPSPPIANVPGAPGYRPPSPTHPIALPGDGIWEPPTEPPVEPPTNPPSVDWKWVWVPTGTDPVQGMWLRAYVPGEGDPTPKA